MICMTVVCGVVVFREAVLTQPNPALMQWWGVSVLQRSLVSALVSDPCDAGNPMQGGEDRQNDYPLVVEGPTGTAVHIEVRNKYSRIP